MSSGRIRSTEFEQVSSASLGAGRRKLRLETLQYFSSFCEIASKTIRPGDLRLQNDRIVTGCRGQRGPKTLLALTRIVEIPERIEVDGHRRARVRAEENGKRQLAKHRVMLVTSRTAAQNVRAPWQPPPLDISVVHSFPGRQEDCWRLL
jgi:hypothetical protein